MSSLVQPVRAKEGNVGVAQQHFVNGTDNYD